MHALQLMNGKIMQAIQNLDAQHYAVAKIQLIEALELLTIPNIVEFSRNLELLFPERNPPKKLDGTYIKNMDKENYFMN